jgi:hypothetical protein
MVNTKTLVEKFLSFHACCIAHSIMTIGVDDDRENMTEQKSTRDTPPLRFSG